MFTFLSPLFLIGVASAVIPLLVHLSRSRRTKKLQFSTTRFFTDQFLRSYRMSRVKELLLLICRMALCALFAVALASPMLLPRSGSAIAGQSRAVVLVLDNSASMSLEDRGETLFDRARSAAIDVLSNLSTGDSASLVLAGRRATGPEVLFAEPTPQLGDVRQALDGLQPATLGTDLSSAVRQAREIASRAAADSKEVYVFSDLQTVGWQSVEDEPPGDFDSQLFLVSVGPRQPQNVAITAVQYAAARPMSGVPFAIRPHIRNQGQEPRNLTARLVVDGELVSERQVQSLPGGRWAVPRLHHAFQRGGWHEGYIEIGGDALSADNRRWFAFEVIDSVRVLAINGAGSQIPRLDELFFLKTALGSGAGTKHAIHMDVASPAGLATADLASYRVVVLANVDRLPPAGVERLESFVDRGGCLLMFLGDRTDRGFFNTALVGDTRLHGGLSPGKLMNVESQPSGGVVARFGEVDADHPALAAFDDPRFASLSGVEFERFWTIEPIGSRVLMRADSGPPLLVEKVYGRGRVMLFASTCDRDWTNFPVRPVFLPWIYRLVAYLAQEPLAENSFYQTGDMVPLAVSAQEGVGQVLLKTPDGSIKQATLADDLETAPLLAPQAGDRTDIESNGSPNPSPLVFAHTEQAGVYQVYTAGMESTGARFAANLESFESDLTYLDESGVREHFADSPSITYIGDARQVNQVARSARRGIELWDWALWIVLVVAMVEPWLANRISMGKIQQSGFSIQGVVSG